MTNQIVEQIEQTTRMVNELEQTLKNPRSSEAIQDPETSQSLDKLHLAVKSLFLVAMGQGIYSPIIGPINTGQTTAAAPLGSSATTSGSTTTNTTTTCACPSCGNILTIGLELTYP